MTLPKVLLTALWVASAMVLPAVVVDGLGTFHHDGFIEEMVTSKLAFTGAFIPNPRGPDVLPPMLLIASKSGIVHIMEDPDNSVETMEVLNLENGVCTNGERGMQTIVPHPNFTQNFYLYVYYTAFREGCVEDQTYGPKNRLSRFTMDPDTLLISNTTEELLLEGAPTHKFYHNGGAIKFGNDGKLYVTTGDGGGDSLKTSQDMTNLHGSVLRLNDDGSVPEDNPFVNTGVPCGQSEGVLPADAPNNAVCSEIYSFGLRNPFRIIMNTSETERTQFHIHDVGGSVWEEISEGGDGFAGKNYGWPIYEGPCKFGSTTECPLLDPTVTVEDADNFVKPKYYYEHRSEREGGAVTGGTFVPPGIWPSQYKYIYTDFIFQEIYNLVDAPELECTTCIPPVPAYKNDTIYTSIKDEGQHENFARIVDMFFGPYNGTQALYIFKMGATNNVWRIRYTGSTNAPPIPYIELDEYVFDIGEIVAFNGSQTTDVDDVELTYEWDFGDGDFSQEQNPIHVYNDPGAYTVWLSVSDSADQVQTTSVVIMVGTPPVLNITWPEEGHQFFVGEVITLQGEAYNSSGDPAQISWEVRKHHADHWHPFLDQIDGNNVQLDAAPSPEDYHAATNSYLEIIMYATDNDGLVSTAIRYVYPQLIEICVDSEPQGLEVLVDEYPIVTPMRITSWVNHDLRLRTVTQDAFAFSSWSDAVIDDDREIRLIPSYDNSGVVAHFCSDGNATCVAEARASDVALAPRCPTEAPSGAPSGISSVAPTSSPSLDVVTSPNTGNSTTSNQNGTVAPDEGEPFPDEDGVQGDDDDDDDDDEHHEDPIPDRPHDETTPPPDLDEDIQDIWDNEDSDSAKDDSAAISTVPVVFTACLLTVAAAAPFVHYFFD